MAKSRSWWHARRIKHRDAVALSVLSAACLLAGQLSAAVLAEIYVRYLEPVADNPPLFVLRAALAFFAFTTAFGALLVLLGGWYFLQGRIARGRALVALGIGLTAVTFSSRLAYSTLVTGTPLTFLFPLGTTLTGIGMVFGLAAHVVMGQYALLLKKRARDALRRWRRAHRPSRGPSRA